MLIAYIQLSAVRKARHKKMVFHYRYLHCVVLDVLSLPT